MIPKLRHLHLRTIIPYQEAQSIQHSLVTKLLAQKAAAQPPSRAPLPTLLTFTTTPTYTTGRREHEALSQSQLHLLQQPLPAPAPAPSPPSTPNHTPHARIIPAQNLPYPQTAQALSTLRGGLTTFHGPGQLVIYPTLDLISPHIRSSSSSPSRYPRGISARCYISLLEAASINTLARWGIQGVRTENPGVWVIDSDINNNNNNNSKDKEEEDKYREDKERKIAAVGVHLRRNVTSFGVGLNVDTDLRWFERIVACGLVGKGVGSMTEEVKRLPQDGDVGGLGLNLENVATVWGREFAKGIWGDGEDGDGEILVERVESVEELWKMVEV
ncbi:hypothetical protein B7463_g921, partial [Scytalidium lignicola]